MSEKYIFQKHTLQNIIIGLIKYTVNYIFIKYIIQSTSQLLEKYFLIHNARVKIITTQNYHIQ